MTDNTNQGVTFNTTAIEVGNKVSDGQEFLLITRSRQGEDFQVWSSGDPQQTEQMYRQAHSKFQGLRQTATT